jgi:hypothetical protein
MDDITKRRSRSLLDLTPLDPATMQLAKGVPGYEHQHMAAGGWSSSKASTAGRKGGPGGGGGVAKVQATAENEGEGSTDESVARSGARSLQQSTAGAPLFDPTLPNYGVEGTQPFTNVMMGVGSFMAPNRELGRSAIYYMVDSVYLPDMNENSLVLYAIGLGGQRQKWSNPDGQLFDWLGGEYANCFTQVRLVHVCGGGRPTHADVFGTAAEPIACDIAHHTSTCCSASPGASSPAASTPKRTRVQTPPGLQYRTRR